MSTSRKKPGVAFWATVVVVVGLVAYPLSFGPARWWFSDEIPGVGLSSPKSAPRLYWPVGMVVKRVPSVRHLMGRYGTLVGTRSLIVPAMPDYRNGWWDQPEAVFVRNEDRH